MTLQEGWHRLHDDQDEDYDKVTKSMPSAGKKDLANKKGLVLRMKPRAVLIIGVMIGVLAGYGVSAALAPQTSVPGPGAKTTLTVTPSTVQFQSFTMTWPNGPFTISLTNTGTASVSGTCTATFSTASGPITNGQGSGTFTNVAAGASANVAITVTVDVSTASSIGVQC